MSNDNWNRNFQETIRNDPDESTTEAYPNVANSLFGPNLNIAPPNQSMKLDARAAMASVTSTKLVSYTTIRRQESSTKGIFAGREKRRGIYNGSHRARIHKGRFKQTQGRDTEKC